MAGLQEVLLSPNTMESVTLPMVRYRIAFEVTEPVHLPEYSGSTIRGAFGGALRRVACMTRQKELSLYGYFRDAAARRAHAAKVFTDSKCVRY